MAFKKNINRLGKGMLYDDYYYLTKEPKEYDKITKYEMFMSFFERYNENPKTIINLCTTDELLFLKKVLAEDVKKDYSNRDFQQDLIISSLNNKFLLDLFNFECYKVIEEIKETVEVALSNLSEAESRKKDELNYLIIGLIRAYYVLTLDQFYELFSLYHPLSYIDFKNYLKDNIYLKRYITSFEQDNQLIYYSEEYESFFEEITPNIDAFNLDLSYQFKKEEIVSIGKNLINLEDDDIKKFYNLFLKEQPYFYLFKRALDGLVIATNNLSSEFRINYLELVMESSHKEMEIDNDILEIYFNALNKMPNWANRGIPPTHKVRSLTSENDDNEVNLIPQPKIGRNELCPCGSGKKYKKCCLDKGGLIKKEAILSEEDAITFYALFVKLCYFANTKHNVIKIDSIDDFYHSNGTIVADHTLAIRDIMWEDENIIDEFVTENKENLTEEEISIVNSWKRRIKGLFTVYKYDEGKAILIGENDIYAVSGISNVIAESLNNSRLPVTVEMILLPFKDVIIYDSFINRFQIFAGPGIVKILNEEYDKKKDQIITKI